MADLVILDRIEPGSTPPYCTHGRATCIACGDWCWLGSETVKVVLDGEAEPICHQCAHRLVPPGRQPDHHVNDHLRADGPHE